MVDPIRSSRSEEPEVAIRAVEVSKSYGTGETAVYALRGLSFDVRRGERIALLGRSGSGKSTLLHLLGGLDRATSGGLSVEGHDLGRFSDRELTSFRSVTVGMIFQGFNLIPARTALENVELPMVFAGRARRERRAEARRALDAVGLGTRLHHRPTELSGGESQRVAIARALVNHPEIVLADEPTGNLDSATAHDVIALVLDYVRAYGKTLVLVTHDEELAASGTTRVLRLADGRLVS